MQHIVHTRTSVPNNVYTATLRLNPQSIEYQGAEPPRSREQLLAYHTYHEYTYGSNQRKQSNPREENHTALHRRKSFPMRLIVRHNLVQ